MHKLPLSQIILFLFALCLTASFLDAQEWTRFRGPNGSGVGQVTGLPNEISSGSFSWVVKIGGHGHSSPVLWGGKLFVTVSDAPNMEGSQRKVLCYDAGNGELLWEWIDPMKGHHLHKFNNFASSTPVVDAERVYLVWGSGAKTQAVALSHQGELIWRREWPGFTSDHGYGSSPILADDVLVFHTDAKDEYKSYVVGLNPADGKSLWEVERVTPETDKKHFTAYNTPITAKAGGVETVVALQSNDGWKGIHPKTGKVIWSAPGGYSFRSVGSIISGDGFLFASFGSGGDGKQATTLRLDESGAEAAYSLTIKDGLGYVPTPLVHEGDLILWADGGILTVRDLASGKEKLKKRIGGNFFSSPVLTDGKIICCSRDGELVVIEAGGDFEVLGRSRLGSGIHATPALANGSIYFRTDTHLMCVCGK